MERYKFEENIREKFEARELEPSKNAWEKLSAKLPEEKKKNNSKFVWMAVAASFIGILILASVFFKETNINSEVNKNQIVLENPDTIQDEKTLQNDPTIIANSENSIEKTGTSSEEKIEKNVTKKTVSEVKQMLATNENKKDNILEDKISTVENKKVTEIATINPKELEQNKIDEVVVAINKLKADNANVTIAEVDALLAKAEREIKSKRNSFKYAKSFEAEDLLADAEMQLDRTFRDRVFTALGESFQQIKTAFVERNQ